MFGNSGNIYTIYENTAKADPADRVEVVREGFAFFAFVFGLFWLLTQRLWLPAIIYVVAVTLIQELGAYIGLSEAVLGVVQVGVQFILGCHAYDLKRWVLARRGYTMRGVVCAPSSTAAQQRVFAQA